MAWAVLQNALSGDFDEKHLILSFTEWVSINIKLEGEGYSSNITPRVMAGFIELQKSINRATARIIYNEDNTHRLTDDERRSVELVVKVSQGSSKFDIDLSKILGQLIDKVGAKMSGRELVVVIMTIALLYGGNTAWKSYLDSMAEESKTQIPVKLSELENKRLVTLKEILAERPALKETKEDIIDANHRILKGATEATTVQVQGHSISGNQAHELVKTKRERSKDVHLDANFRVLAVDTTHSDIVKVRLRSSGEEFSAQFKDDSLNTQQIQILKDRLISRELVRIKINASMLREKYVSAEITFVDQTRLD